MAETIELTARLDLSFSEKLVSDLKAVDAGTDIILDASDVVHFGALCAQAILATARRTHASGASLKLENVSERVEQQLGYMGLNSANLMEGTA